MEITVYYVYSDNSGHLDRTRVACDYDRTRESYLLARGATCLDAVRA